MREPLIEKNPIILAFMQKQKPVPYSLMSLKRDECAKEQAYNQALIECAEIVQKAPAIDAVEVVKCKDCIHYNAGFECLVEGYGIEREPDWYCADGERREG